MTFDPMATAIDWLDAYRAGDIETILAMSSDAAVVECGCSNRTIIGKERLRAYWEQSLKDYPASDLDDLQSSGDEVIISYVARDSVVGAILEFDPEGRIARLRCEASRAA
jgi:ketosteroid isomerase-like protein